MTRRLSGAAREAWWALGASAVAAAVMTWPTLRHPGSSVPQDTGDPLLQAWQLAWDGHALVHQPGHLFDTNTFYPLKDTLAFSDSLLGYAPLGLIGSGPTAALVRYNLLFVAVWALSTWGAYLLARQLGARRVGAAVAGAVFAYAPWRLSQSGHLNVLSTGPELVALALLARGHGYRLGGKKNPGFAHVRPGYALLGWIVAAWQVTLGFGLGLAFVMVVGLVSVVAIGWWLAGRPVVPRRLVATDVVGAGLLVLVTGVLAVVYLHAVASYPEARRQIADVKLFSPPWKGLITTPATDWVWGPHQNGLRGKLGWPPEMTIAPGLTAVVLALVGTFAGRWSVSRRIVLAGSAVTIAVFALGTSVADGRFTYRILYDDVPGWQGVRTPSRLIVWTLACLALLAAAGADRIVDVATAAIGRPSPVIAPAVGVILAGFVALEGVGTTPHPDVPGPPAAFGVAAGLGHPLLVLPSDEISDEQVMWWSTAGFPLVANGGSGVSPGLTAQVRQIGADFLAVGARSDIRAALSAAGIRTIMVQLPDLGQAASTALLAVPTPAGVTRRIVGADAVYSW